MIAQALPVPIQVYISSGCRLHPCDTVLFSDPQGSFFPEHPGRFEIKRLLENSQLKIIFNVDCTLGI